MDKAHQEEQEGCLPLPPDAMDLAPLVKWN